MSLLPVAAFEARLQAMLALCRSFVEAESPTTEKAAVDAFGRLVAEHLRRLDAEVRSYPQPHAGDHWLGTWGAESGGVLMLAHLDTVHPLGTLAAAPWREDGERAYGPGVLDMKASVAIALTALEALRETGNWPARRVSLLCTSDEETGSHTSRALIEALAREHDLVLCLEPALADGGLKTWRKGVGVFELHVHGRAAHAGVNPEEGVSAIREMARQIEVVAGLADPGAGTTLNVGVITGGTRSNVVAERCRARIDVRVLARSEQERVEAALRGLRPTLPGAELALEGEWNRPPMERTAAIAAAFERARNLAAQIGINLAEGGTGGASDANFVAPLGVPLLDGLGAVGEGAHSEREHILVGSLPRRAALLAAVLTAG